MQCLPCTTPVDVNGLWLLKSKTLRHIVCSIFTNNQKTYIAEKAAQFFSSLNIVHIFLRFYSSILCTCWHCCGNSKAIENRFTLNIHWWQWNFSDWHYSSATWSEKCGKGKDRIIFSRHYSRDIMYSCRESSCPCPRIRLQFT